MTGFMLWVALVLGVVEGLTEFLPISSTGHLILVSRWMGFHGKRAEVFQVFIQLGAILAVVWDYRARLWGIVVDLPRRREARAFVVNIGLAFIPAAVIGLALDDLIFNKLDAPFPIALALVTGAVLIFVVEGLPIEHSTVDTGSVSWRQALGIGLAQCVALWPGFSRSLATILGGLGAGLDRRTAVEFSFFLAVPTMFAASFYKLLQHRDALQPGDGLALALSFAVSFVVAWASIRWLLRFVSTHSFRVFAWYRLALGGAILLLT